MAFEGRNYLFPIYADRSQKIVLQKSVQCGISEWLIISALTDCEAALSVFYVLPKFDLRNTFVANRVDKLFNMVAHYRQRLKDAIGDADSKQIKHFANGTIKFASSNTISDFSEFPADTLIIDELDRCDQSNLAFSEDRIKSSKYKLTRKVGNPTITGYGISYEFKKSDQKEWMVKCDACGNYNELDFFKTVVEEINEGSYQLRDKDWTKESKRDIHTFCVHCGKPFNRLGQDAYWHRKNPESEISGYHISRLMDQGTTVKELWNIFVEAQSNETKKQAFYNSDLGIPYESKGAKLSEYLLDQCIDDYSMPSTGNETVMGVDVGSILHVHISAIEGTRRRKLFVGNVPGFEDIDRLIKQYGVECGVVDALPETHKAKELRDRFKGIIWLCSFHGREGGTKEIDLKEDEYRVNCDRTQIMDESHADILKKEIILPKNARSVEDGEFYSQMCAPTRVFDQEANRFVWREGNKPDHHRLADTYEKIASIIKNKMGVKAWTL